MLSERKLRVLQAAVDRIIPADDYPSGWEAGVGDYILRQLAGDLRHLLRNYQMGLHSLDEEARQTEGSGFVELSPAKQDALLARLGIDYVEAAWSVDSEDFLAMLVAHASEGYYSDPGNGGNWDRLSWKMIGFEVTG